MEFEIVKTDTPDRSLLLLADESEESVADYAGRGTTYAACRSGQILGQYVLLHTRPFTAEVVNIAVAPAMRGSDCSKSARETSARDRSPCTNGAVSSAAASTKTTSGSTTPLRFSKTA